MINDSDEPTFYIDITEILITVKEEDAKSKISKAEYNNPD